MEIPDTRYVKTTDGIFIAFQVFGSGPHDLLFVPGSSPTSSPIGSFPGWRISWIGSPGSGG